MTPKYPSVSLGPAVKNNWLVAPLLVVPPPNSIPHSPLIVIAFPAEFLIALTNLPVVRLNPLMVPAEVLFETNSVPLSVPKLLGATATPHGWFSGLPLPKRFTNITSSPKRATYPPHRHV